MLAEAVILKDVFPYLRRRMTFLRRGIYAGGAAAMVMIVLAATYGRGPREMAEAGRGVFDTILWLVLIAGLFECTVLGSVAVSSERERNTVDLWVLAGAEHVEMVLSKALVVLTRAAATLVAPVVPAAVVIFLGGRSVADAQSSFLAVISILVIVTSVSVAISAGSQKNASSIPACMVVVVAAAVVPWMGLGIWAKGSVWGSSFAAGLLKLHPFAILGAIGGEKPPGFLLAAFGSLLISLVISLAILVAAGVRLAHGSRKARRSPRQVGGPDRLLERLVPPLYHLFKPLPGNVDEQPIRWRERIALANYRGSLGRMTVWDKLILTAAGAGFVWYMGGRGARLWFSSSDYEAMALMSILGVFSVTVFVLLVSLAVRASQAFTREFETRQMELIQLTCLDGEEIVSGKMRAYVRHSSPLIFMSLVWAAAVSILALKLLPNANMAYCRTITFVMFWPFGWSAAVVGVTTVALISSLYFRSGTRALFGTLALCFLLPLAAGMVAGIFLFPLAMLPVTLRLVAKLAVAVVVLAATLRWVRRYDKTRFYGRRDCLVFTGLAVAALPLVAGPIVAGIGVFLVAYTLMRREFDTFLVEEPEFLATKLERVALSYQAGGLYSLTHLGIPPSVEKRFTSVLDRVSGRDASHRPGEGRDHRGEV